MIVTTEEEVRTDSPRARLTQLPLVTEVTTVRPAVTHLREVNSQYQQGELTGEKTTRQTDRADEPPTFSLRMQELSEHCH